MSWSNFKGTHRPGVSPDLTVAAVNPENSMKKYSENNTNSRKAAMAIGLLAAICLLIPSGAIQAGEEKIYLTTGVMIRKEIIISAPVDSVWQAWTIEKGIIRFFAPAARIELAINGQYEMLFDPSQPEGQQGGEGNRILSFVPNEMLSFTWNAPPSIPLVRNDKTWVVLLFRELGKEKTALSLVHLGWQPGDEWQKALKYFDRAWEIVLARLEYSFQKGPINWKSPYTPEMKRP